MKRVFIFLTSLILNPLLLHGSVSLAETNPSINNNKNLIANPTNINAGEKSEVKDKAYTEVKKLVPISMDGESSETTQLGSGETLQLNVKNIFDFYVTAWNLKEEILTVTRKGDGIVLVLNLRTGELKNQDVLLGTLPKILAPQDKTEELFLPLGAIEALTGTNAKLNNNKIVFELDARLKTVTGFNLFVNGKAVVSNDVKAIGNTLLIPINIVTQSLGQRLNWDTAKGTIENFRIQDSANIQLQLSSGLITINGRPQGIAPGVFQADPNRRLLPANIVETLTGTNIRTEARTGNIYIDVDARLSGTVTPSKLIGQELKNTPFTIQGLDYQLNSVGKSRTDIRGYWQAYNGLLSYETLDKPWQANGLTPSMLGLKWQNANGNSGSLGDINLGRQELSGVDVARVRGASAFLPYNNYALGLAGGTLLEGVDANGQPKFGGSALGFRYYPKGETWEAGISALDDPLTRRKWLVAAWQKQVAPISGDKNPFSWNLQTDVGMLNNEMSHTNRLDLRSFGNINKQYHDWQFNTDGHYVGAGFRDFSTNSLGLPPQDEAGSSVSIQAPEAFGVTVALKMAYTLNGVQYGRNQSKTVNSQQISLSGRHFGGSWNASYFEDSIKFADQNSLQAQGIAPKNKQIYATWQTEWHGVYYYLRHERDLIKHKNNTSGNINFSPWSWSLPKGANVTINMGGSGFINEENKQFKATGNLSFNSGTLLGPKWLVSTGLGANTTLSNQNTINNVSNISNPNGTTNTYSDTHGLSSGLLSGAYGFFKSTYRLNRGFEWIVSGQSDFKGNALFFTGISGTLDFSPPRPATTYLPNRGVLKGRVFFDENYNNKLDTEENGLNGAIVSLGGTSYRLATDSKGYFTITNLLPGLYDIQISKENLPLDFSVSEKFNSRATVGPEEITEIIIPVQRLGVIRGQLWEDNNNNNQIDENEQRVEGAAITLYQEDKKIVTTNSAFAGQYSFGDLQPGIYRVESIYLERKAECLATLESKKMQMICPLPLKK